MILRPKDYNFVVSSKRLTLVMSRAGLEELANGFEFGVKPTIEVRELSYSDDRPIECVNVEVGVNEVKS